MNGILLIDKEPGYTSFDVIAILRGVLHMKKIGHGGTLDPEATGVLPVFLGNASKLSDYLPDSRKVYEAELLLGRTTDTEDIWGKTLEERPYETDEEAVKKAVLSFIGEYYQTPPMVSAKKVNGKKLYELARSGQVIERKPVLLHIDDIRIRKIDLPRVSFTVSCEKGTYIRTLSADIGKKLGCGACMSALRRTRHGSFSVENAYTLDEVKKAVRENTLDSMILPVEEVLPYESLCVPEKADRLLLNGNKIPAEEFFPDICIPEEDSPAKLYKISDSSGVFRGVFRLDRENGFLVPDKMFL